LEAGLNQAQMGELLGMGQSAVSRIEGGKGDMGLLTLLRYLSALDLDLRLSFEPHSSAISSAEAMASDAELGDDEAKAVEAAIPAAIEEPAEFEMTSDDSFDDGLEGQYGEGFARAAG